MMEGRKGLDMVLDRCLGLVGWLVGGGGGGGGGIVRLGVVVCH